jgi:hypothetical protein
MSKVRPIEGDADEKVKGKKLSKKEAKAKQEEKRQQRITAAGFTEVKV